MQTTISSCGTEVTGQVIRVLTLIGTRVLSFQQSFSRFHPFPSLFHHSLILFGVSFHQNSLKNIEQQVFSWNLTIRSNSNQSNLILCHHFTQILIEVIRCILFLPSHFSLPSISLINNNNNKNNNNKSSKHNNI